MSLIKASDIAVAEPGYAAVTDRSLLAKGCGFESHQRFLTEADVYGLQSELAEILYETAYADP